MSTGRASIDLYWLPLGAGGTVVRWNGRLYEALSARRNHRPTADLYHAALLVTEHGHTFSIEMGPVWNLKEAQRGVVRVGPVGARWLGRFRLFRYEIRCWRDGRIPDLAEAVDGPRRVSTDEVHAATILKLVHSAPTLTWGRDELQVGDMWNSNSLVSWLLARTGLDTSAITPPENGRAPGWDAGLALANSQIGQGRPGITLNEARRSP
ncbi:hypothetical protein IEU95_08935 [Hoyosella rhizosphaerae]|uniref:Uncharacterized protein n=1 Tax=Hoyosella rhizosphaerae TaxID=1755582 RepID=A0A916U122_9ACTN|nr:hypothetical protein [Hoyosella rhizosphaerae]MBN4926955.1 hypothetical protein [Hoyosella rhizosphaerae]GGC55191.1 hypothetical protein GCM10011410_04480 [Hoyosella rhizosphaerae]